MRPEVDEAEANSYEAKANSHEAEAKIALIFSARFYILIPFKKTKFSVDFRRNLKNVGSKRALTWGFISKHPKNDQLRLWTLAAASVSTHWIENTIS